MRGTFKKIRELIKKKLKVIGIFKSNYARDLIEINETKIA